MLHQQGAISANEAGGRGRILDGLKVIMGWVAQISDWAQLLAGQIWLSEECLGSFVSHSHT